MGIKGLPRPKSMLKRIIVLVLGGVFIGVCGYGLFCLYDRMFSSMETALMVWAITQGVINAIISPAKLLTVFRT